MLPLLASCGDGTRDPLEERAYIDYAWGRLQPGGRFKLYQTPERNWVNGFISTQPIRNPCFHPPDGGIECELKVQLRPGGVLAFQQETHFPPGGWDSAPAGDAVSLWGREALLARSAADYACVGLDADESVELFVKGVNYEDNSPVAEPVLTACLRGPGLRALEAELLAFLNTATPIPGP